MRLLLISMFVIFLVVLLTPNAFAVQKSVLIYAGIADDNTMNFSPSEIEIEKGDTITWKNLEKGVYHTVTREGLFDERLINCAYFKDGVGICSSGQKQAEKQSFSYTFEESGTYEYNCKLHNWMSGVVYVDQSIPDSPQNTPSGKITVETDFQSYKKGDLIQIHGSVGGAFPSGWKSNPMQVIVQTFDPRNNLVRVDQFFPKPSGHYDTSFYAGGPLWKFEGDYTVKVNFAGEVASTTFALTIPGAPFPSPPPSTQSKIPTVLTLYSLPATVKVGETLRFSGSLETTDGIPVANEKIFLRNGVNELGSLNTRLDGTFSGTREMHQIGNDYMIFAFFYGGSSNFETAKSQTHSLKVFPEGFPVPVTPATPEPPPPDDNPYAAIAGLVIMIVIIAGIGIGIRRARKKRTVTVPAGGGTMGTATITKAPKPRKTPAGPIFGKWNITAAKSAMGRQLAKKKSQIRQVKSAMGRQSPKAKSKMVPMHYLRCEQCRLEDFLVSQADGHQYCTSCGWKKK